MNGPSSDQQERFRTELERLWIEHDEGGRFGVAVSGGPDSLALLLLAHAALPGRVVAATVDHGLRPESADEAAMVADVCQSMGVRHAVLPVEVKPGNTQDRARAARYEALCRYFYQEGCDTFGTAHHAQDQAETLLMRLNRGSGLVGMSGIRARRIVYSADGPGEFLLVRPLLHWRREELADIVGRAGLEPAVDPSNTDMRYDRVRAREALATLDWIDPQQVARTAQLLQDVEDTVDNAVSHAFIDCVYREGGTVWFHPGHSRLVEIESVLRILREFGSDASRSSVERMVERLRTGKTASLGGVTARRAWHHDGPRSQTDAWRFEREPPRNQG